MKKQIESMGSRRKIFENIQHGHAHIPLSIETDTNMTDDRSFQTYVYD